MAVVDGSLRVCHLMAHNGRADTPPSCPLLGLKQPRFCSGPESAFDPKRTFTASFNHHRRGALRDFSIRWF